MAHNVSSADVLNCDYTNLEQVIALANKFGPGMVVIRRKDQINYNITHRRRKDRWLALDVLVVYFTKGRT